MDGEGLRLRFSGIVSPGVGHKTINDFQQYSYLVSGPNAVDLTARVTKGIALTTYVSP